MDNGPWIVTDDIALESADFTHDVQLRVLGDFEGKVERVLIEYKDRIVTGIILLDVCYTLLKEEHERKDS